MDEDKLIVRVIIEILGAPKEHVEETMQKTIEVIQKNFDVRDHHVHKAKQMDKLWGTFVEVELRIKKTEDLIGFCFDFMPSSIEILEPSKLSMPNMQISDLFNEILARLHQYDMVVKNLNASNKVLKQKLQEKE